jgi:hypothetical protein
MKLYQIYFPELATYVKYKALTPEEIEMLIVDISSKGDKDFKKLILENVVHNLKTDIAEALRLMARASAERAIEALYNGCVALNPRIRC